MSKILIIPDAHFGVKNDSQVMMNHFDVFYQKMFKMIDDSKVDKCIILGDVFDRRKYQNNYTVHFARKMLFDKLLERNIQTYCIVGNHDSYWKNSIEINTPRLLLSDYSNLTIIDTPQTITIDGVDVCFVPWICDENEKACHFEIANTKAPICIGHFEIAGFEMFRGQVSEDGLVSNIFSKFDKVISGHYHHKSEKNNIVYVGTAYQLTWNDYGDEKGVHILDTISMDLDFFKNDKDIFIKVEFDNGQYTELPEDIKDCFVKVVTKNKSDLYKFELFINKLNTMGCFDVKIVDDINIMSESELDEEINIDDTLSLLQVYVSKIDEPSIDKDSLNSYLHTLYIEALNQNDNI